MATPMPVEGGVSKPSVASTDPAIASDLVAEDEAVGTVQTAIASDAAQLAAQGFSTTALSSADATVTSAEAPLAADTAALENEAP